MMTRIKLTKYQMPAIYKGKRQANFEPEESF